MPRSREARDDLHGQAKDAAPPDDGREGCRGEDRDDPARLSLECPGEGPRLCRGSRRGLYPLRRRYPEALEALAEAARSTGLDPKEVWTVSGSGTLTRGLQIAWPDAKFFTVRIGSARDCGKASIFDAPEKFENDAKDPPPWPSCANYDAKAWQFMKRFGSAGALFWNVGA